MGQINEIVAFDATDRDCKIPVIRNEKDFAEVMRMVLYRVSSAENDTISTCGSLGGKVYPIAQLALKAAIAQAYPEADVSDVMDIWSDCNESIEYCAKVSAANKAEELREREEWAREAQEAQNAHDMQELANRAKQDNDRLVDGWLKNR